MAIVKPPRSRAARSARRLLRIGILVYLVMCGLLFSCQRRMVFPAASSQGKPETHINYGRQGSVVHFTTAGGVSIAAVFAAESPGAPTILYFYGNGSSVAWSESEFDRFRRLGCNVLIPDYAGYGDSGGSVSEAGCYQTAEAAYDWLVRQPGIDPHKVVVVGWSLGGAVAIDLASKKPVAGLAVFNAFTTMGDVASNLISWAPVRLLLRYKFDNLSKIPAVKCPVLICNGKLDTLVDPAMGDRLAAAAKGPVTRFVVERADHNTIFSTDPAMVYGPLGEFIRTATEIRNTKSHEGARRDTKEDQPF
jgi:fermentation-respiration switch protein FrsA (DUF1100 family)